MKKHRYLKPVLLGLLGLIAAAVIAVAVIANINVKAMNRCIDESLEEIGRHFTVTEVDPGEYARMELNPLMKFDVEQYDIEGVGNLSVMRVNMGIMQMATLVITPAERNMPLLSADYMYILGTRKSYLEFYDVVAQKDDAYQTVLDAISRAGSGYDHLEAIGVSEAWYEHLLTVTFYKTGGIGADDDLRGMLTDCLSAYLDASKALPLLDAEAQAEKRRITVEYTDGLIEKGGISTDVFKDALGDEETKRFFDQVFFGTAA